MTDEQWAKLKLLDDDRLRAALNQLIANNPDEINIDLRRRMIDIAEEMKQLVRATHVLNDVFFNAFMGALEEIDELKTFELKDTPVNLQSQPQEGTEGPSHLSGR